MSKQHLTEKDWVTLVLKQKLKMEAELKAFRDSLIEYEKLDGKPKYSESEAALENVRKKAVAAKAKNTANKDIGKYLDAVVAEVANSRADLSERQKAMASQANQATAAAARKADTAKEEETGVDQKLIEALVKIAHGAEMQFAACLGKPWAVAVAKPITPQHKAALTDRTQGSKRFILGTCIFEDEAHTFVVAKSQSGLAKNIKLALLAQTKKKYKVRVRDENGVVTDDANDKDFQENTEEAGAARLAELLATLEKTRIPYARKQELDEAARILTNIKQELVKENTAFNKDFPGSKLRPPKLDKMLTDIDADVAGFNTAATKRVTDHLKEWLPLFGKKVEDGGLNTRIQGVASRDEAVALGSKMLPLLNKIEDGVRLDAGMLKRMSITSLDGPLQKVRDMLVIPKKNVQDLAPQRTTQGEPPKAPDVNRPEPKGVADPKGWNKACDDVDLAIAKGEKPDPENVKKMAEGAGQALAAETRWKWEPDLNNKWDRDWNKVKGEYKRLLKEDGAKAKEFMSGYWWFRKSVVDQQMDKLATKYGFDWESVGSTNLESDYDISVKSHGTKDTSPKDWEIVQKFNDEISKRFGGVQPGTLFDTNLYASAPPPELKAYEQKTQTEKDMDAMTEAGQDVGALMKLRRYMSWEDYVEFQNDSLAQLQAALQKEADPAKKKAVAKRFQIARKQFEEADSLYFASLQKILQTAKVPIPQAATADTIEGQKMLVELVDELEENPDKLMAATNEAYVENMKDVRAIEDKIKTLEGKDDEKSRADRAALVANLKTLQTDAVYFAAEAYHSDGPYKHIVQANQKSAQEVKAEGLSGDAAKLRTAGKVKEKLDKLPLTQFLQSFNEQLGDFLKDLKHYEHKSPFPGLGFYRSSKYLERLCDSMVWIAKKLEGSPAQAEFKAIKISGKDPGDIQKALGSLVAVRGGKVEFNAAANPEAESEAYSMQKAQEIFGSRVQTLRDLGDLIKNTGKQVNAVLRKAQAGEAMTAESENAYFAVAPG